MDALVPGGHLPGRVGPEDGVIDDAGDQSLELFVGRPALGLGLPPLGHVGQDADGPGQVAVGPEDRVGGQPVLAVPQEQLGGGALAGCQALGERDGGGRHPVV